MSVRSLPVTPSHLHRRAETNSDSSDTHGMAPLALAHGHSWKSTLTLTPYNVRFLLLLKVQEEAWGRGQSWECLLEGGTPYWRVPWKGTVPPGDPCWSRDTPEGTAAVAGTHWSRDTPERTAAHGKARLEWGMSERERAGEQNRKKKKE